MTRKLAIIIIVFLFLVGAAFAAWYTLDVTPQAQTDVTHVIMTSQAYHAETNTARTAQAP